MSKLYSVTLDVFFMEHHEVYADNEEEAKEKAIDLVHHGMGEEVTVFEIEEVRTEASALSGEHNAAKTRASTRVKGGK